MNPEPKPDPNVGAERDRRTKDLFDRAITLPLEQRRAFIVGECADVALALEIRDLVAAHEAAAGGFMSQPTRTIDLGDAGVAMAEAAARDPLIGARIGTYKILQEIGEGGFGTVFMAEQKYPVQRKVAMKIIKAGMDSRQVVARFEAERQALALMGHQHIARVFDGGVTDPTLGARPYFVMEYVIGDPITTFADAHKLSVTERLNLFAQVCQAVQHAHMKGVIHRDIKPGNVLVNMMDDKPFAKVIDFGIAKATGPRLTDKTLFTEHRQLLGTPQYMSPEQAEGSSDIDTRTDVYGLGVLLYELLTSATPFDAKRLRSAAYAEMQRIIREEDPLKPSMRLSRNLHSLASVAAARREEPARLKRTIRGDLDWIVMKALEKDRARRYETANQLAADVQRYLERKPVLAAPPSTSYKLRKFVRRNRAIVVSVLAIFAVLTGGLIVALREKGKAEVAETKAVQESARARAEATRSKLMKDLFDNVVAAADPIYGGNPEISVREAVVIASNLTRELSDGSASVEAEIMATIGTLFQRLGEYERAEKYFRESLSHTREHSPAESAELALALSNLAESLCKQRKYVEAEHLSRMSLAMRIKLFGVQDPKTAWSVNSLGVILNDQGKPKQAEPLFRQVVATWKQLGRTDHPEAITALGNLAMSLQWQGSVEEAEPIFRSVLKQKRQVWGAEHPEVAVGLIQLFSNLKEQGKLAEASVLLREAIAIRRKVFGYMDPAVADSLRALAVLLESDGRLDEAEPFYRDALALAQRRFGDEHRDTTSSMLRLANLLCKLGKGEKAEELAKNVYAIRCATLGENDPMTWNAKSVLGAAYLAQSRFDDAEASLLGGFEGARAGIHLNPEAKQDTLEHLVKLYEMWDKVEPEGGYDMKAATWRVKLRDWRASSKPAPHAALDSIDKPQAVRP